MKIRMPWILFNLLKIPNYPDVLQDKFIFIRLNKIFVKNFCNALMQKFEDLVNFCELRDIITVISMCNSIRL